MKRLEYDEVKNIIEVDGYSLKSKKYINAKTKLEIICPKKHIFKMLLHNFKKGQKCPTCSNRKKYNIYFIKNKIKKEKYLLLEEEYLNNHTKMKIQCPIGHTYRVTWKNWSNGKRCPYCKKTLNIEQVKRKVENNNYKLLTEKFKGSKQYIKIQCPIGHIYKVKWNNFQQGCRCPYCSPKFSKGEKEVLKIVKSNTKYEIYENDRTQITNPKTKNKLELDIWIPKIKKAIEFNSYYWHKNRKYYDDIKKQQCKEKGIKLLIINFEDWIKEKEECINRILNFL